ncbi:hypothetical protein [Terriglobus aquaticus]|uniref:Uncharacterized protein n=1 Tax=Terriglobus aquaticus TaxID=940139 RepID=A0ABW9KIN4_9BACT|nr:hypothetical protein [Terriglobus aquaticus]
MKNEVKKKNQVKNTGGLHGPVIPNEDKTLSSSYPEASFRTKAPAQVVQTSKDASERDLLKIQTWISGAAAIISLGGLLLLYGSFYVSKLAADAAREQSETASRQLFVAERPWVSIQGQAITPLTFPAEGPRLTLLFKLHNHGQTPAIATSFIAEMHSRTNLTDAVPQADSVCHMLMGNTEGNGLGQETVFPGEDVTTKEEFSQSWADVGASSVNKSLRLYIVGCAVYRSTVGPSEWHYTETLFDLNKQADVGGANTDISAAKAVGPSSLFLNTMAYPQKAN